MSVFVHAPWAGLNSLMLKPMAGKLNARAFFFFWFFVVAINLGLRWCCCVDDSFIDDL